MSEFFLEALGIEKSFGGVHALRHVDLRIKPGQSLCLAGENGCGKSTLIKIISGAYEPDSGQIVIEGTPHSVMTPRESIRAGIQVIYQDFSLFHNLSAAENICMAHNLGNERFFNKKRNREMAQSILDEVGVPIDPDAIVDDLPIAQRQVVAICRALLQQAKLVIMDEPTTALTSKEVANLYKIIEGLKRKGISLIFVSHKLDEVFTVADHIVVLRNGENVTSGPMSEFDKSKLTFYMTGKEPCVKRFDHEIDRDRQILEVAELTAKDGSFSDVSFGLFGGEVLGITGLLGSGREALAEALFAMKPCKQGRIVLCGKELHMKTPGDAVNEGIGYVPEDRAVKGLYLRTSIARNIASAILGRYSVHGFLQKKAIRQTAEEQAGRLRIKAASLEAPASSLSGGNQQRIVLAKWLATQPKLLILNCPTVGVDVGSKSEIHELARQFARDGIGIILISDDIPEILAACNRVLVMNNGRITGCYDTETITEAQLQEQLAKS